ncbi:Hypothetical Protein sle_08700 [Streptomyces leeuwenhoekii]|uniref:Uncharacterized protein n=1 Tax=Streptomyces leeuwenhoekii TaxID=1437453 RepID=A0A0F7VPD5_STRLW|nr:Hypothetical Protein sle_08700 [Streptomyces leeuwenhoekii]
MAPSAPPVGPAAPGRDGVHAYPVRFPRIHGEGTDGGMPPARGPRPALLAGRTPRRANGGPATRRPARSPVRTGRCGPPAAPRRRREPLTERSLS